MELIDLPQITSVDSGASRRLFLYFIRNKGELTAPLSIKEIVKWHAKL
jgi:hypothetical protein